MNALAYRVGRETVAVWLVSTVAIILAPKAYVPLAMAVNSISYFVFADASAAVRGERIWFFRNLA